MTVKIVGAILIFLGCGGYGFYLAANQIRETKTLNMLLGLLHFMLWELRFKLTPLPDLCRNAASEAKGSLKAVFEDLADELDNQVSPNAKKCMDAVLVKYSSLPPVSASCLRELGGSLGRFDLTGQLEALEAMENTCILKLEALRNNQDARLRSYRTIGICCGAALVILFI